MFSAGAWWRAARPPPPECILATHSRFRSLPPLRFGIFAKLRFALFESEFRGIEERLLRFF